LPSVHFANLVVLRETESPACHLLMWEHFLSDHPMCRCRSPHLPVVSVDWFPIPSASHRSINGMLKRVQYSRTWGNGSVPGTSQSREKAWKMPFGVSAWQPGRVWP